MGWLRTLMNEASPPWRSFDALARAALSHSEWPDDTRPQSRSLAAILSKLDRELELDWLVERPRVQHALADLLQTDKTSISQKIGEEVATTERTLGRFRLDDVPFARPIELSEEPMLPGVPGKVLRPGEWRRLWWHAPSGSGRTLVGRWLEARGLARFVEARTLSSALDAAASTRPIFIELDVSSAADLETPATIPEQSCIAAPWPPSDRIESHTGVERVDSPAIGTVVRDVLHWLAPRLARDGRLDPEKAAPFLERAASDGTIDSLGTLLGLAGLVDEIGIDALERQSLAEHARELIERRFRDDAGHGSPESSFFQTRGFDVVAGLVLRTLTDDDKPWDRPRSASEWIELLPVEFRHSVDTEWVRATLARSTSSVTVKELERALRELPPGGFRVIRGLEGAGLLRPIPSTNELSLCPRWVGRAIEDRAKHDLALGSPFEWGEALLRAHAAPKTGAAISKRICDDPEDPINELLELGSEDSPAYVAALEAAFRYAGLAVLQGTELAHETLEALWDAQLDLVVDLDGIPHPRIAFPPEVILEEPGLALGSWYLAALAISESLSDGHGRAHGLLRPWGRAPRPTALDPLLDAIEAAVTLAMRRRAWAARAFALVERLERNWRSSKQHLHGLEVPGAVLDVLLHRKGTLILDRLGEEPYHLRALLSLVERRGLSLPSTMRSLWLHMHERGIAARILDFDLDEEVAAEVWGHVPAVALSGLLANPRADASRLPYELLPDEAWDAVLETGLPDRAEVWQAMPGAVMARALGRYLPSGSAASAVWARSPDLALARLDEELARGRAGILGFLAGAPDALTAEIAARIQSSSPGGSSLAEVKRWLYERVGRRTLHYRSAYAALTELTRRAC